MNFGVHWRQENFLSTWAAIWLRTMFNLVSRLYDQAYDTIFSSTEVNSSCNIVLSRRQRTKCVFYRPATPVRQSRRLTKQMYTGELVVSAIDPGRSLEVQKTVLPTVMPVPSLCVAERLVWYRKSICIQYNPWYVKNYTTTGTTTIFSRLYLCLGTAWECLAT
jgi:hypothetical protein